MFKRAGREDGFTLPELLVVAGLVFTLIVLSMVFAHPRNYSVQNRNLERQLGVAWIMQALNRYVADNGRLPDKINSQAQSIGNGGAGVDLCAALVPQYAKTLPLDPSTGIQLTPGSCATGKTLNIYVTGYTITQAGNGTVTIAAPAAERNATISISRKF